MSNPKMWHKVVPLTDFYTIMCNGSTRSEKENSKYVVTTKGKELYEFSDEEKDERLKHFKELIGKRTWL